MSDAIAEQGPTCLLRFRRYSLLWSSYRFEFGLKIYGNEEMTICRSIWLGSLSFGWMTRDAIAAQNSFTQSQGA